MSALQTRYDLLRARLDRFSRMLPGVEKRDIHAIHRARVASRRLRELMPVLQLESSTAAKLSRQLRKVTRRLGPVREADVMLLLMDELHESGRLHPPALQRVRSALQKARDDIGRKAPGKAAASDLRRLARKLDRIARTLQGTETAQSRRAWRWAIDARISRRAAALKRAVYEAGPVYLPERLHVVRIALKKLRYGLELAAEADGNRGHADLRRLKRLQELLGRLHDWQVLVERVRRLQASLSPPDLTAWRDLNTFVISIEQSCRRLHARYVGERQMLLELCDRLGARTDAPSSGRRSTG